MTIEIEPNLDSNIVRIFVIRHGQTEHNRQKILQGHLDVDINETGYEQADKVGKYLSGIKFDTLVSSDLTRCVNTLKQIIKHQSHEISFRTTPNLRERQMGPVEGMYLRDALEKYGDNFRNMGETSDHLLERLDAELDTIIKHGILEDNLNIGVCTHGGVLINLFNHLYADKNYKLHPNLPPSKLRVPFNTSVSILDIDKSTGEGTIQAFGLTKHLGADLEVKNQLLR